MEEYEIQRHKSSPYRPQTNGVVEAANKNFKTIINKMIKGGRDWAGKLLYALWDYRTTERVSTGATPFSLTNGSCTTSRIGYSVAEGNHGKSGQ